MANEGAMMNDDFEQMLARAKADPDDWEAFDRLNVLCSRRQASLARVLLAPFDNGKPYCDSHHNYSEGYRSVITTMGEVVAQVDEGSYQGDSFVLLRRGNRFAYFTFGWGSCSGCDAMEASK